MRRFPVGVVLCVAAILAVSFIFGCSKGSVSERMPQPSMIVLAERNRMVWLSDTDDDQLTIGQELWDAISLAGDVPAGSTVSSETVNTVMRTGAAAGLYFREGLGEEEGAPVGVVIVLRSGEATGVADGDVLHMFAEAVYRVSGRMPDDALASAQATVFHRMGLQ